MKMTHAQLKKKALSKPPVKAEYDSLESEFKTLEGKLSMKKKTAKKSVTKVVKKEIAKAMRKDKKEDMTMINKAIRKNRKK